MKSLKVEGGPPTVPHSWRRHCVRGLSDHTSTNLSRVSCHRGHLSGAGGVVGTPAWQQGGRDCRLDWTQRDYVERNLSACVMQRGGFTAISINTAAAPRRPANTASKSHHRATSLRRGILTFRDNDEKQEAQLSQRNRAMLRWNVVEHKNQQKVDQLPFYVAFCIFSSFRLTLNDFERLCIFLFCAEF